MAGVIAVLGLHHIERGVHRIGHRRARDRLELRWPGIDHVEPGGAAAQGCLLRDARLDQRLLRLRRSRHRGEHEAARAAGRDACEIGRQAGGGKGPRTVQAACRKPATRHQVVELAVAGVAEQRRVGVGHVLQAGSGNGRELRRAERDDDLGRHRGHEDLRHVGDAQLASGNLLANVGEVAIVRQSGEGGRQRPGRRPVSFDAACAQPGAIVQPVPGVRVAVEEDAPVGVDGIAQGSAGDRGQHRCAIEDQQAGRAFADEDVRRLIVHRDRRWRLGLPAQAQEKGVQRHALGGERGQRRPDVRVDTFRLGGVGGRKTRTDELGIRQRYPACRQVGAGGEAHLDGAQYRRRRARRRHTQCDARPQRLPVGPGDDLRLIDDRAATGTAERVWPAVGRCGAVSACRRSCSRRRRAAAARRAQGLLARRRGIHRILLQAGHRRRATGRHPGTVRLIIGAARLTDGADLRRTGLLCRRRQGQADEQYCQGSAQPLTNALESVLLDHPFSPPS
jgi:hypothetical protein